MPLQRDSVSATHPHHTTTQHGMTTHSGRHEGTLGISVVLTWSVAPRSSFLKGQQQLAQKKKRSAAAARCSVLGMQEGRVCNDGTRHRLPTLFANKGGDGGKVVAPTSLRDLVDCPQ